MTVSADDVARVEELLGRPPGGEFDIVVRDEAGDPVVLRNAPPDLASMIPGALAIAVLLPLSYLYFKRAESYFADVI